MHIANAYSSLAANTAAYVNDCAPASGTAVTLLTTEPGDDLAHKVIFTNNSATDYSGGGKVFAVVGTGFNGAALTENVAGPGSSTTSTSTGYFLTITSITPNFSRGTTDTIDIGFTAAAVTPPVNVAQKAGNMASAMGISVDVTGTPAYSLQQCYGQGGSWYNHAVIATKTADADGSILFPVWALRLIFTAASAVTLHINQAGQ
jgi:hypothetical protein